MIKYLLMILFVGFHFCAYNQIVNGVVINNKTKEVIPFATIYFNGTTTGTSSNLDGLFEINIQKHSSNPIVVSAIGYNSELIEDLITDDQITVKLRPKIYDIDEAVVQSKSLVRQRRINLRIFKREFIGETENSWDCKILNEEDISFNYFHDDDTLKAYTSKPIIIENKALGYNITYFLDKFEYYKDSKSTYFRGNFIFKEDSTINKEMVEKKREYTYNGSRMHFFRSLWADDLKSNDFKIRNSKGKVIKYKDVVIINDEGNKYLRNNGNITIQYHTIESKLILSTRLLPFNQNGSFGSTGILWEGDMSIYRIADWLPLDYKKGDVNPK